MTMQTPKDSIRDKDPSQKPSKKSAKKEQETEYEYEEESYESEQEDEEEKKQREEEERRKKEAMDEFERQKKQFAGIKEELKSEKSFNDNGELSKPLLALDDVVNAEKKNQIPGPVSSRSKGSSRAYPNTKSPYGGSVNRTPRPSARDVGAITQAKNDNALDLDDGGKKNDPELKRQLMEQQKAEKEQFLRELEAKRQQDAEAFKNANKKAANNIIFPEYENDERLNVYVEKEETMPPPSLFMGCGYDSDPEEVVAKQEAEKIAKGKPGSKNLTPATRRALQKSTPRGTPSGTNTPAGTTPGDLTPGGMTPNRS